jgi:hypothetical protein
MKRGKANENPGKNRLENPKTQPPPHTTFHLLERYEVMVWEQSTGSKCERSVAVIKSEAKSGKDGTEGVGMQNECPHFSLSPLQWRYYEVQRRQIFFMYLSFCVRSEELKTSLTFDGLATFRRTQNISPYDEKLQQIHIMSQNNLICIRIQIHLPKLDLHDKFPHCDKEFCYTKTLNAPKTIKKMSGCVDVLMG